LGFCSRRRPELQKKQFVPPSKIDRISPASGNAGRRTKTRLTPRGWSLSTRLGSKPTWRRSAAGGQKASVSKQWCLMVIGRP
jgi:hypothetical protein